MRGDQVFTQNAAGDQMFLDDSLQHRRIALSVPSTFRVDDCNRTTFADAQAVGFGAKDAALFGELQLFETPLQERPCGEATLLLAAFRFGLIAAEKNMAPRDGHTDAGRDFSLGIGHLVVRPSKIATGRSVVAPSRIVVEKMW
jgi:hypothetical protein